MEYIVLTQRPRLAFLEISAIFTMLLPTLGTVRNMHSITSFIENGPFIPVFLFLVLGVWLRSTVIWSMGRYANYLATREKQPKGFGLKIWAWAHSPATQRTMVTVRRRGWIAVSLCYLTVGVQSLIVLSAGILAMRYVHFVLASLPGWLAWASIYSTIGFALWRASVAATAGSDLGILLIVICVSSLAIYLVFRAKHRVSTRKM